MSPALPPLLASPLLAPSQDFYRLRREGIGFIQAAGSAQWTDYNVHDPGITILEALCYAITDIGYRLGWRIEDILAPSSAPADPAQPFPNQAFFTARNILTVNPVTENDFRRTLIDLPGVRDAWIVAKQCACEVSYWAFCDLSGQLVLQYGAPSNPPNPATQVWARGLYEVLLELQPDAELGDLNDRTVVHDAVYHDSGGAHPVTMELRFPDLSLLEGDQWQLFLDSGAAFADSAGFQIELLQLGASKSYNVFNLPTPAERNSYLQSQWSAVFYVSLRLTLTVSGHVIDIRNATLRVFADSAVRNAVDAENWRTLLQDTGSGGFVARYQRKAMARAAVVSSAKAALQSCRNLAEDYCLVSAIGIEDVAICADIEVTPDADIDRIQAEIWFQIEQYLSPPVRFQTLQELQDAAVAVEDIFDGPALESGFIAAGDLDAATLKTMLRASEIISRLMAIDGVIAVNQLRMSKYDAEGNVVAGAADPSWNGTLPVYDPGKVSAAWLLAILPRHQPRLYLNQSRFLFYKNGLPLLPSIDDATDTLNQLLGNADRPKIPNAGNDLPIPPGLYRSPEDYTPVQYGFPLTYGIGTSGLPSSAPASRQAQARNLKAYLLPFEQLLGNALAQLAHTADLFSLDSAIERSYFVKAFDATLIKGFADIADPVKLTPGAIEALIESVPQFQARRNAFLDHLLARFGESFRDYALLLTNTSGQAVAQPQLIENKIAFLKHYPEISHDRARAFDYAVAPCAPGNDPGIKGRISLLLGFPDLRFAWTAGAPNAGSIPVSYQLLDGHGQSWLSGTLSVHASSAVAAQQGAQRALLARMVRMDAYVVADFGGTFVLSLTDAAATEIGRSPPGFATQAEAEARRDALQGWSANSRALVVEHILLRPKFIGDALYPACCDGACACCGNEDPYSFRLSFIMPGWTGPYADNLDLRRYAESTIQQETPSHLLGKTCWVGNDGFVANPCDEIIDTLADLLIASALTTSNLPPAADEACTCANAIYHNFGTSFSNWYATRTLTFLHADALQAQIGALFQTVAMPAAAACTTVFTAPLWNQVQALMTRHFVDIALRGGQFERFEWTWCQWLDANATIDWTEQRLPERVEAILAANVQTPTVTATQLCACAHQIVTDYGAHFHAWMQGNLVAGNTVENLTPFVGPTPALCPTLSFAAGTQQAITALLSGRYASYAQPSYWLWAVVTLLAGLRNIYPGATLHDCSDVGSQNPVRLDSTVLGNYPQHTTL